jgi:hypothetical protein
MITPRRYWLSIAALLAACLLLAGGWRETWLHARYESRVQQVRWEEQEARLQLARDQVDALMGRLGLPKWWKNWKPPKQEALR